MVQVLGSNIFVGDIIKLTHNQTVPCDLLLVATSDQLNGNQVCKVDSWFDDGKSLRQVKEAVSLTKSFNHLAANDKTASRFLARLNAKVEYWIDKDSNTIEGTFKLKSDPRIETLAENMIVRKGSLVKSKFLWGLVLFNGNSCISNNEGQIFMPNKLNSIQFKVRSFSLVLITINIALACLNSLFFFDKIKWVNDPAFHFSNETTYLTFISLFFSMMPLTLNITLTVITSFAALILQRKYSYFKYFEKENQKTKRTTVFQLNQKDSSSLRLVPHARTRSNSFKVLNPEVILDLGDIDHVFFDKTDTLTTTEYDVKTIANLDNLYLSDKGGFFPDPLEDSEFSDSEESLERPHTLEDIRLKLDYTENSMIKNKFLQKTNEFDFKTPRMPIMPFENGDERLETEEPLLSSGKETNLTRSPSRIKSTPLSMAPPNDIYLGSALLKPSVSPQTRYKKKVLGKIELWNDRKTSKDIKQMLLMFTICHKSKCQNQK